MKLTIAILCYNYARFLRQAINSALIQSVDGYIIEILVIDDGSLDNTLEICRDYSDKIRVVSEGNHGFASSLSRAVRYSSGTIVFFLDADDYFLPGKLASFIPFFESGKLFVCDKVRKVTESSVPIGSELGCRGSTSTIAVSRKAALDLLPLENELSFHVLADAGHGKMLDCAYTCYRVHDLSMTDRKRPGRQNLYLAGVTLRLSDTLLTLSFSCILPDWIKSRNRLYRIASTYRSRAYYNLLESSLETGHVFLAYVALVKMLFFASFGFKGFTLLHLKMIVRTVIVRPSFPK